MDIRLMIIDDDPIHHKIAHRLMKKLSHQINYQCYLHALDAFAYISDNNYKDALPDLILLDLNMPLLSGWAFVELFETISLHLVKPVDIVILTSSINPADMEKAQNYSFVKGFFNKPFTEELLIDILSSSFLSANNE